MADIGPELVIERVGHTVNFTIICASEYEAMMLYDRGIAEARSGNLDLSLILAAKSDTP